MPFSQVAMYKGMNLYMKMNIPSERTRLAASTQPGSSFAFWFFFFSSFWISSSETSAENLRAFMPSDIADDHVLQAAGDGHVTVPVDDPQVAAAEEPLVVEGVGVERRVE